jgi:uncharacterized protein
LQANLLQSFLAMEYRSVKGFTAWAQFGFLCALLGMGFVLAGGIQLLLSMQILPAGASPTDASALMKAMTQPQNVGIVRVMQVISTFVLLCLPAVLLTWLCYGKNPLFLGFSKHINVTQIFIGFLIIYVTSAAAGLLADFTKTIMLNFPVLDAKAKVLENNYKTQALALSNLTNLGEYLIGLVIMAFLPAVFEEIFFRGTLQNIFIKWWNSPLLAIFVSAAIFSLIHSSIYLFLTRMAMGVVLGLMFYYTKNIWINIIAHFINNALALTALYLMPQKDLDKLAPQMHWSISLAATAALIGLFFLLQKKSVANRNIIVAKEQLLYEQNNYTNSIT